MARTKPTVTSSATRQDPFDAACTAVISQVLSAYLKGTIDLCPLYKTIYTTTTSLPGAKRDRTAEAVSQAVQAVFTDSHLPDFLSNMEVRTAVCYEVLKACSYPLRALTDTGVIQLTCKWSKAIVNQLDRQRQLTLILGGRGVPPELATDILARVFKKI